MSTRQNKICIVCPYFGPLPNYIDLVFKSCSYNKSIDWLIYSDCENYLFKTDNVKIVKCSLEEFRKKIQDRFDFKISLKTPYKLCDYRPAYGYILEDVLSEYDFWGHCDLDMVFGDIRGFCPDEVLSKYNKIFTRGHLALYRNTPEVNRYYKSKGTKTSYETVFSSSNSWGFDEMSGINQILREHNIPQYSSVDRIADIGTLHYQFKLPSIIINQLKNYRGQVFYWEDGHIWRAFIYKGEIFTNEFAYIHFKQRKFAVFDFDKQSNYLGFFITPEGFKGKETDLQLDDFNIYNRTNMVYELPYLKKNMKDKLKHLKNRVMTLKSGENYWE